MGRSSSVDTHFYLVFPDCLIIKIDSLALD